MDQQLSTRAEPETTASQVVREQTPEQSKSVNSKDNTKLGKEQEPIIADTDSASEYSEDRVLETTTEQADEHDPNNSVAGDAPEGSREEGDDESDGEDDDDHHDHHSHNMDRDPEDDPEDDLLVQPKTRFNNRPHGLFEDLRKTLGSPFREETKCPICKEKIMPYHRTLTHLACDWSFHRSCLETWLLANPGEQTPCPIDRKPLQMKELSKNKSRFLTPTERKIQEAWPRCSCHLWPNIVFTPENALHRNHFFEGLPPSADVHTRMAAIVVAHLIDCARYGLIFNFPGFDGLMDIWHDLFYRTPPPPHPNAGNSFFEMIIAPGIPVYLDPAQVKEIAAGRFRRLETVRDQLPGLRDAMGEDRVVEFIGARNEAIMAILGGAEDWNMSLEAVEARQRVLEDNLQGDQNSKRAAVKMTLKRVVEK
ncbi:hypothetical protein PMZ80_002795 [Knufia obscura]|uniref:RING-type domain-containing protein n=2 Tax=Knufia TaxID=430999 RepID=A0AAN8EYJ1_9EURO|nr:hypothetical protein PMZ80_002795 [Knufia obscura]KAK5948386.1 hypothetical protein OHC33_010560 [Knufia fluminis]